MSNYYVNTNKPGGDYEVHKYPCSHGAQGINREDLGMHPDCKNAVKEAKNRGYKSANGCYYCCNECHTT